MEANCNPLLLTGQLFAVEQILANLLCTEEEVHAIQNIYL